MRLMPILLTLIPACACATPHFEDYPAAAVANVGRRAKPVLSDERSRKFGSILREAALHRPNFSGQYVLATWGCGASCVMGAAINAHSGTITWLPFTVCCWNQNLPEPIEYRRNSRMLVVHGRLDETGDAQAVHYFIFNGHEFAPYGPTQSSSISLDR